MASRLHPGPSHICDPLGQLPEMPTSILSLHPWPFILQAVHLSKCPMTSRSQGLLLNSTPKVLTVAESERSLLRSTSDTASQPAHTQGSSRAWAEGLSESRDPGGRQGQDDEPSHAGGGAQGGLESASVHTAPCRHWDHSCASGHIVLKETEIPGQGLTSVSLSPIIRR